MVISSGKMEVNKLSSARACMLYKTIQLYFRIIHKQISEGHVHIHCNIPMIIFFNALKK